jgi:hypothetical protein
MDRFVLPTCLVLLRKMRRAVIVDSAIHLPCLVALDIQALRLEHIALREVGRLAAAALVFGGVLDAHPDGWWIVVGDVWFVARESVSGILHQTSTFAEAI